MTEETITTAQWVQAREHLRILKSEYTVLQQMMKNIDTSWVIGMVIDPLAKRYDDGERTPELHKKMMEVE